MVNKEQWEYKVIGVVGNIQEQEEHLDILGYAGWELVNVTYDSGVEGYRAYLKRKKT